MIVCSVYMDLTVEKGSTQTNKTEVDINLDVKTRAYIGPRSKASW